MSYRGCPSCIHSKQYSATFVDPKKKVHWPVGLKKTCQMADAIYHCLLIQFHNLEKTLKMANLNTIVPFIVNS